MRRRGGRAGLGSRAAAAAAASSSGRQHPSPLARALFAWRADHMTIAFQPSLEAALALPLGRAATLTVLGAATDNRTQVGCWGHAPG